MAAQGSSEVSNPIEIRILPRSVPAPGFGVAYMDAQGDSCARCTVDGCGKEYKVFDRHLMFAHTQRHAETKEAVEKVLADGGSTNFNDHTTSGLEAHIEYLLLKNEKLEREVADLRNTKDLDDYMATTHKARIEHLRLKKEQMEKDVAALRISESALRKTTAALKNSEAALRKYVAALKDCEDFGPCEICIEGLCTVAFKCGHRACDTCSQKLTHCHFCRGSTLNKLRLY